MSRRGLTLLEVMVALVILGLVVVGYLELFGTTLRASRDTVAWTQAITYAEQGMELAKLDVESALARGSERLDGGFQRVIHTQSWGSDLQVVTVTIAFPNGGQFTLDRLLRRP